MVLTSLSHRSIVQLDSGTRATFEQFVLGTKATVAGANVQTLSSTGEVAKAIGATAGSISYVATSAVRDAANKLTSVRD